MGEEIAEIQRSFTIVVFVYGVMVGMWVAFMIGMALYAFDKYTERHG